MMGWLPRKRISGHCEVPTAIVSHVCDDCLCVNGSERRPTMDAVSHLDRV